MKTFARLLFAGLLAVATFQTQAATYPGNGNTSFGGALGTGSLTLTDDGTTLFGTFTRGSGNHNDNLVIYIDSGAGGFASTSGFNDQADDLRRAVSGVGGDGRSTVNFAGSFAADYAIALHNNNFTFGGLWSLAEGGNDSLPFISSVNLSGGGNNAASYDFSVNLTDLGIAPNSGASFSFVATYTAQSGFRSNEAIGASDAPSGGSHVGVNPLTFSDSPSYVTVPEPSTYALLGTGLAGAFFSLRRRR